MSRRIQIGFVTKRSYRLDEAADQLDVSRRTVERLIQRGALVPFKVGRATRIEHQEIDGFIKKSRLFATGCD